MVDIKLNADLADGALQQNKLLFLTISGLKAVDGSQMEGVKSILYCTELSPWLSTVMRVRMFAGEFLDEISDLAIAQLIQHFSEECESLNYLPATASVNKDRYKRYQSKWVTLSCIIALISGSAVNSMMQKRVGDISVRRDRAAEELLSEARRQLRDLFDMLQDGGDLGRDIGVAVKGVDSADAPQFGRLWADPAVYNTEGIPAANSRAKLQSPGGRGPERAFKKKYTRRKLS
jgi:hypothetical protein